MSEIVEQEVFDSEGLLRRMMGDMDLASEIVTEFVADLSSQIDSLKGSIAEGDEKSVARKIHTIKGASANVGAKELERLARGAEKEGIVLEAAQADTFIVDLMEAFDLFKTTVQENGFWKV